MEERKNMLLDLMKDPTYVPMKLKELAMLLGVTKEQRGELEEVLNELVASGKVGISKKGKYARSEVFAQTGVFAAHHRGFGFVTIEGREDDLFIPPDDTGDAMDGDTVQVVINENGRGGRTEARVLKVLKHANETLIGTFEKNKNFGFVIPDNPRITMDIFIPQGKENGAVSGHKVVVKLDTYAAKNKNPEGHVKEILGHINDPGVDILSIVRAYGLPEEFPGRGDGGGLPCSGGALAGICGGGDREERKSGPSKCADGDHRRRGCEGSGRCSQCVEGDDKRGDDLPSRRSHRGCEPLCKGEESSR